ncbi:MAG TPA: DUF1501 domain-containing protein, partial [Pirellulales bacterium]
MSHSSHGLYRSPHAPREESGGRAVTVCPGPNGGTFARREFLRTGIAGFASLSLPSILKLREQNSLYAGQTPAREKTAVIMVWQPGGCSHIDTYDPKPDAASEYRGPFGTIETKVPGLRFTELLPRQASIADRFTVLRSMR